MRDFFYGLGAMIGCLGSVVPLWVALYYATIRPRVLKKPKLTQSQFKQVQFYLGLSISLPVIGMLLFLASSLDLTSMSHYSISDLLTFLFAIGLTLFFSTTLIFLAIVFFSADLKRHGLVEDV